MQRYNLPRTEVKVARPAVITQAAPEAQNFIGVRSGQINNCRKALKKTCVVVEYGRDLGLLEHDFRQPDTVRVARVLPGQAVTAMCFLPANQFDGELGQNGLI